MRDMESDRLEAERLEAIDSFVLDAPEVVYRNGRLLSLDTHPTTIRVRVPSTPLDVLPGDRATEQRVHAR